MENNKVFIIAEAGVNHNGNVELARLLIDSAARAGADAVKFQTFIPEEVISRHAVKAEYQIKATSGEESQLEMVKKLQLSFDAFRDLQAYCRSKNIQFLSTPFDLKSIDFLKTLNMGLWKIPSGEITNMPYLAKIGSYKEKVIISTGMSGLGDIENAIKILTDAGTERKNISILHCNTEYPTPMADVNLRAMDTIKHAFGLEVGYSDHTLGIEIPVAAVALGATVIEKHFTLDKTMEGPDHKASLEPNELKSMVTAIRNIELAMGDGIKRASDSEKKNMDIARKSIHLARNVKKGSIISIDDLCVKRPGSGMNPFLITEIPGCIAKTDLFEDTMLKPKDLEWK